MPRPKPPIPIHERSVRLTDEQWATLKALGGSDWLRKFLENIPKPDPSPSAALQNVWHQPLKDNDETI